jgi:hypothetical protein
MAVGSIAVSQSSGSCLGGGVGFMTLKCEVENLVRVKTALAEKYERRARNLKSLPGQATAKRTAERYRQQAANVRSRSPQ